jgi:hypothetical protein
MNKLNSTLAEQAKKNNGPKGAKAKEIFLGRGPMSFARQFESSPATKIVIRGPLIELGALHFPMRWAPRSFGRFRSPTGQRANGVQAGRCVHDGVFQRAR